MKPATLAVPGKILGVYPQKQPGLFMQRIKIPAGRIDWQQWRCIMKLAARYTDDFSVHITTRQDIELHNIPAEYIPHLQQGLWEVGLSTFGAGGDSVRNITACPGCEFKADCFDVMPLVCLLTAHLESEELVYKLPRKFKISFSGCSRACAKPYISDLGFIAKSDGRLRVVGAGSLGPKPCLAIKLYEDLAAEEALPLCLAAINILVTHGDRQNRRKARLRHVREKIGDEKLRELLDNTSQEYKSKHHWPTITLSKGCEQKRHILKLQLPNGNISSKDGLELAYALEKKDAVLRINLNHGLEIYSKQPILLPKKLAELANLPEIVSCPGLVTCLRGLADCWKTADNIRKSLDGNCADKVSIRISGCPNNCAQSAIADIGLIGLKQKINGKLISCYRIFTEGGNARNSTLAKELETIPAKSVAKSINQLINIKYKARC